MVCFHQGQFSFEKVLFVSPSSGCKLTGMLPATQEPTQESSKPDFKTAWEITTPQPLPEPIPLFLIPAYQCLIDTFGPLTIRRIDPLPHKTDERTFYQVLFPETLAFRQDGTWNGPGSVSFYGPGGVAGCLDQAIVSAFEGIGYFRGCLVVKPSRPVFGPVRARAGVSLSGKSYDAIDRKEDFDLAMDHVIGRVPKDWPIHSKLEGC